MLWRTIWGNGFSTYYLSYILNLMQAILPRAYLQKWFVIKESMLYQQGVWKWILKYHKVFPLISKNNFENPNPIVHYAYKTILVKLEKFSWKLVYTWEPFTCCLDCHYKFSTEFYKLVWILFETKWFQKVYYLNSSTCVWKLLWKYLYSPNCIIWGFTKYYFKKHHFI
jgi:hypothetical protein